MKQFNKEAAPELATQEQLYEGVCEKCDKINTLKSLLNVKPAYCMNCGSRINYSSASLRVVGAPQ